MRGSGAISRARWLHLFAMRAAPVVLCGGALSWSAAAETQTAVPPKRIISLNLCADQLVLALADREQIAGLTRNAIDPQMSAESARARDLHTLGGSAEEILAIRPDLVVGMPARGNAALRALGNMEYKTLDLPTATSLNEIYTSIRATARAVGHRRRGDALIARMKRDLAAVPTVGNSRIAVYYQRRGYVTGSGTLVDGLIKRAGLINLAGKLGKPVLSHMSLEEIVAAQPDFLIVESATDRIADQGTEMLHHPALSGIPRISISQAWTVCGGPAYVLAARSIADQIARSDKRRR